MVKLDKKIRRSYFAFDWRALRGWIIAVVGSIGVTLLLMFFAGVFTAKVPESRSATIRMFDPNVKTAEVRLVRRARFESAVGSVEPVHQSSIASKIMAKVREVNVGAGQEVKVGEILVSLYDDDLQSRLKQAQATNAAAKATAEQARSDFARAKQLMTGNAISRSEYETALTFVRTSEALVEQTGRVVEESEVLLQYATIASPIKGIVVDKMVQAGDMVSPGQTLLTVYDPSQMQLVANVRESFATQLKIGQSISARLETLDHECLATVREVVPQAEAGSRSFQVKVSGPCPPGIYSGMFGRILLPLEDEEVVIVPRSAIQRVGQLTMADVVDNGTLMRRSLQLGRTFGEDVEVLSGLKPGERVTVGLSAMGVPK